MAKRKKNKKKNRSKIISIVLLPLIMCLVSYVLYVIVDLVKKPTDTYILESGEILSEESTVAYIIRDETLIEDSSSDNKIEQIKKEGEKVAKGSRIFKYYNVDEESINLELEKINQEIQTALEGQTDLLTSDIKAIESQIENKIGELRKQNNIQEIIEYKRYIENSVVKKAKIAGSLSSAGQYINSLITRRIELENTLTEGSKYVNSPRSGVVSYRIDNLENTLVVGDFSYLSEEFLENLDLKTGKIVTTSNNSAKIVNNFECYIALVLDSEESKQAKEGDKITLRILSKEVKARIEKIIEDKDRRIIVLKISQEIENLIEYRKISAGVIWWKNEGLKVPRTSIIYENGLSYIVRKNSGKTRRILVKITKENQNYCIVENYETEELKELGFTANEINSMSTIKRYDEIVVNPELE